MAETMVRGVHAVAVRNAKGEESQALLQVRFRRIRVLPPIGKQRRYPPQDLTIIHATEVDAPEGRERIEWKLATDLAVGSPSEAIAMLKWYALRWKIETFHKILKSGCKAESSRLRTAERLSRLVAVFCILAWRVFWMTMANRSPKAIPVAAVFTNTECRLLDHLVPDAAGDRPRKDSLSRYITKTARLGGYLARKSDPPPGNIVMWRGLARLTDLMLGLQAAGVVGN